MSTLAATFAHPIDRDRRSRPRAGDAGLYEIGDAVSRRLDGAAPRRLQAVFAGLRYADSAAWQRDVLDIWRGAEFREERYAAIELTGIRAARPFQTLDALAMYEEMIVTGAWWDYVDAIATQRFWADPPA